MEQTPARPTARTWCHLVESLGQRVQVRVAHLIRTGNLTTPWKRRQLARVRGQVDRFGPRRQAVGSSFAGSREASWIDIMRLERADEPAHLADSAP